MSAARVACGGARLVLRVVACRARATAAAVGWLTRAGCARDARRKWTVSCTGLATGSVAGAAWPGVDCTAETAAAPSRAARCTGGLGCAGSTVAARGAGSGVATGAAPGASDGSVVNADPVEGVGAAAAAVGTAAATGAAGAVGASPVAAVGGGGAGDGAASDGGAVATRAGKNPAGSR